MIKGEIILCKTHKITKHCNETRTKYGAAGEYVVFLTWHSIGRINLCTHGLTIENDCIYYNFLVILLQANFVVIINIIAARIKYPPSDFGQLWICHDFVIRWKRDGHFSLLSVTRLVAAQCDHIRLLIHLFYAYFPNSFTRLLRLYDAF